MGSFRGWIADLGPWGAVMFAGVYIIATVLLVPVSVLTIVAGLAFGLAWGFALVVVSATIGATLAFLVRAISSTIASGPWPKAVPDSRP